MQSHIRFQIGQPIAHKISRYRGVVVYVDPAFSQTESCYDLMHATINKQQPWYWILLDDSVCMAYMAEQELIPDLSNKPIQNPFLADWFTELEHGLYKKSH